MGKWQIGLRAVQLDIPWLCFPLLVQGVFQGAESRCDGRTRIWASLIPPGKPPIISTLHVLILGVRAQGSLFHEGCFLLLGHQCNGAFTIVLSMQWSIHD